MKPHFSYRSTARLLRCGIVVMYVGVMVLSAGGNIAAIAAETEPFVTMDFRDTEIADVLRLLAKQNKMNVILSDAVRGPVTVQFTDVTINEALDAIVTVNGYAYTRRGRIIKVTTPEEAEREAPTTRVFALNNASALSLKTTLQSVLSPEGMIEADSRSNSLIVTDDTSVIMTFEQLVKQLDTDTRQVMIEARLIETVLDKDEKLGIDWNMVATVQGASRPTTFPFPQRAGSFPQLFPEARSITDSVITAMPNSDTETYTKETVGDFQKGREYNFPVATATDFSFGTLDFSQFTAVMEALDSRDNTTILANPSIVTLDNQEAKINVGTTVPIPLFERNDNTGEFEIIGYEDQDTGIILTVTPHVTNNNMIKLELHPEVSTIISYVGDAQAQVPVTSKREAVTQVSIRDGQTVVIGGLIDEKEIVTTSKVPFLGSIPLLGKLFSHSSTSIDKTDLLIFVTAHILTDEKTSDFTYTAQQKAGGKDVFPDFESHEAEQPVVGAHKPFKLKHRPKKPLVL